MRSPAPCPSGFPSYYVASCALAFGGLRWARPGYKRVFLRVFLLADSLKTQ